MGRYTGKKNRIARRFNANIFGRRRNPLLHKPNPPGMHGGKRKKKSDFGLQLEEKQKLKACYGMLSEKQLNRYYQEAVNQPGNTMLHLMERLEARLDIVVYRMGLAPTIFAAQQLVAHGHVNVNGKKVDVRSFKVEPDMEISIRERSRKMQQINDAIALRTQEVPEYHSLDPKTYTGKMLTLPSLEQIPLPIPVNVAMVCEFLAHHA